jgi:hypothetical protein
MDPAQPRLSAHDTPEIISLGTEATTWEAGNRELAASATNRLRPVPDYGQYFAQVASRYASLRREATDDVADWLVTPGEVREGHELVDVGCGTGAMTALLAARAGVTAVGFDASEEMLQTASSRASDHCRVYARWVAGCGTDSCQGIRGGGRRHVGHLESTLATPGLSPRRAPPAARRGDARVPRWGPRR